jgi:hypothetical protein
MNNERRGNMAKGMLIILVAIWATTALLTITTRVLHFLTSIALTTLITAALVAVFLKALAAPKRSDEER